MSKRNRRNNNQESVNVSDQESVVEETKKKKSVNDLVKGVLTSTPVKVTGKVLLYGCTAIGAIAGASYLAGARKSYTTIPRVEDDVPDVDDPVVITYF